MRQVVVTGLGAITPLGVGVQKSWARLIAGHTGVVSTLGLGEDFRNTKSQIAGLVPKAVNHADGWAPQEMVPRKSRREMTLFMQYALVAAREALEDAQWYPQSPQDQAATGVAIGSGIGSLQEIYETTLAYASRGARKVSPYFVPRLLINLAAGHVSMEFGLKGPNQAATSACTTGAHAIADAARQIMVGDADVMIAGGSESCIHPLAFVGFERLKALSTSANDSPELASRPFSPGRDGFIMGEGAGLLVLEELQHARARDAKIYAHLAGFGASADAFDLTRPPEDGEGAFRSMRSALRSAKLEPRALSYINAHATSTPLGDAAEARAIAALLESCHGSSSPAAAIGSTKGATGHLLGAAGAVEAIFAVLALASNVLPPTLNLDRPDPNLPKLNYVGTTAISQPVHATLSNSFGFGGTNASLCFTKP